MKKALILEDIAETRTWLSESLQHAYDAIECIPADTIASATALLATHQFDIAIVDLGLPDGNGVTFIRTLSKAQPNCVSIVASIFDSDRYIFPAFRAGARGYVLKEHSQQELANMLKGIYEGKPPLSPSIALKVLESFHEIQADDDHHLTPRETDVLTLIAKGNKVSQVATLLKISQNTVAQHIKNIYRKLNISSRAEAAMEANRLGLVLKSSR